MYVTFIDLENTYDRVPRRAIWGSLRNKSVPGDYTKIVKEMYRGPETKVRNRIGMSKSQSRSASSICTESIPLLISDGRHSKE